MYGPFVEKPFPVYVSPVMVRNKPNSIKKRTIVDLSWSMGQSVNNGMQNNIYLDTKFLIPYPSVDYYSRTYKNLSRCKYIQNVY